MALPQFSPIQDNETLVTLKTNLGDITLRFFPQEAPKAVENFVTHAKNGYYDGVIFHRVISGFMIQGGDPQGTGMGGESIWGKGFGEEFSDSLYHFRGALCMAKSSLPNSQGSQFYIVTGDLLSQDPRYADMMVQLGYPEEAIAAYQEHGGYFGLDNRYTARANYSKGYTVFGQVTEGMDVVDAISAVKTNGMDKPLEDVTILSVEVVNP